MSTYQEPVERRVVEEPQERQVIDTPPVASTRVATAEPVATEVRAADTRAHFSLSQVVHGLTGLFLLIIGAIAMARAGFTAPLNDPVVQVLGIDHTAILGIIEASAGVLLLIAALSPSIRGLGGLVGIALLVGGIMLLSSSQFQSDLHTESSLGWMAIIVGAIALIGALLPTHFTRRQHVVDAR
jgi:hypothetical protein